MKGRANVESAACGGNVHCESGTHLALKKNPPGFYTHTYTHTHAHIFAVAGDYGDVFIYFLSKLNWLTLGEWNRLFTTGIKMHFGWWECNGIMLDHMKCTRDAFEDGLWSDQRWTRTHRDRTEHKRKCNCIVNPHIATKWAEIRNRAGLFLTSRV